MAILEINLEKPALMEEIVDEEAAKSSSGMGPTLRPTGRSRGSGGSMLRKVAMMGAIVAVLAVARRMRGSRSSGTGEPEGVEVPIEGGSSGSSGGGQGRRIAGIVLAVLGAVAVARRMQGRNSQ